MFRSHSASHTPRPSIVSETSDLPILGEVPTLPDEGPSLLMSNSAVSILSISLNEEMLRANGVTGPSNDGSGKDSSSLHSPVGKHVRKHSLGSNVEHEFAFMEEDKSPERRQRAPNSGASAADEAHLSIDPDPGSVAADLDETIIPQDGGEIDEVLAAENKENVVVEEAKGATGGGETEEGSKKRKKGLSWLLLH